MENTKGHQILQNLLNAFNQNTETVLELFNADATVEYPYAASMGMAPHLNMADYRNHLNRMLGQMPDIAFTNIQVYPLQETDSYWAEFNGQTTVPVTNALYTQQYVVHFTLRDGKFATYKEYWNVLPVLQTLLGKEDAQRILNHQQNA